MCSHTSGWCPPELLCFLGTSNTLGRTRGELSWTGLLVALCGGVVRTGYNAQLDIQFMLTAMADLCGAVTLLGC